jgi:hypothetical protein
MACHDALPPEILRHILLDNVTADQIFEATGHENEQAASEAWHEFHGRQDDLLKTFGRRRMDEARATWAARQEIMRQPSTVTDRRTQTLLDGVGAAMGHDFTPYVGRAAGPVRWGRHSRN